MPSPTILAGNDMADCLRIALTGTQSTGKTTLAKALRERLGLEIVPEAARDVVFEMGFDSIDQLEQRHMLELHERILDKQLASLDAAQPPGIVCDRGVVDTAAHVLFILGELPDLLAKARAATPRYTHLVYLPVEFEPEDDGFRRRDPEWARQQDEAIQRLLSEWQLPYLRASGSVPERVAQILAYVEARTT